MLLSILVGADGRPERIDVKESSGYPRLDAAAVAALGRCRFDPKIQDGVPIAAAGVLRFTFRRQVDDRLELEGVTQVLHLRKYVDAMSKHCSKKFDDRAAKISASEGEWHKRNDATARRVNAYKQQYYEKLPKPTPGNSADRTRDELESNLQSSTSHAVLFATMTFDRFSADEQATYCDRYIDRLDAGQLELNSVIFKFPELENALTKDPAP